MKFVNSESKPRCQTTPNVLELLLNPTGCIQLKSTGQRRNTHVGIDYSRFDVENFVRDKIKYLYQRLQRRSVHAQARSGHKKEVMTQKF